jgi:AcrR family transcriptional regulator
MKSTDLRRERENLRRKGYREMILHAAERVIVRKGFSALTMDDVAREAQLSKATIYKYVPGKGDLLFEIIGHYFDDLRERLTAIAEGPGPAADKLGRLVQVALQSGEEMKSLNRMLWMDKAMFRLMRVFAPLPGKAGAAPAADRKMMALLRQKRQALVDLGDRILTEGVASGEFRRLDTAAASDFIEAVLQGYMHVRFWRGESPLTDDAPAKLTRFIIEGIRTPGPSGKEN